MLSLACGRRPWFDVKNRFLIYPDGVRNGASEARIGSGNSTDDDEHSDDSNKENEPIEESVDQSSDDQSGESESEEEDPSTGTSGDDEVFED